MPTTEIAISFLFYITPGIIVYQVTRTAYPENNWNTSIGFISSSLIHSIAIYSLVYFISSSLARSIIIYPLSNFSMTPLYIMVVFVVTILWTILALFCIKYSLPISILSKLKLSDSLNNTSVWTMELRSGCDITIVLDDGTSYYGHLRYFTLNHDTIQEISIYEPHKLIKEEYRRCREKILLFTKDSKIKTIGFVEENINNTKRSENMSNDENDKTQPMKQKTNGVIPLNARGSENPNQSPASPPKPKENLDDRTSEKK